ncbi:alpha/beta hydrolase [Lacticaseibacillus pabuli]|uniref:Alpha/beta hydrolase n=1 Tax=Lacticaseibacillus pabuli TaxID=3025672 RepID=A0ABY7WQP7_9LACO|nr:alpha/beta hydrolase [Lacticaseibacillus sp. KACC 23028]WDF82518.1 alpha/beta hydrolase [Lacticaseibacillus sp. KACC 23028]
MIISGYKLDYLPTTPGAPWALIVPGGGYWGWMDISEGKPVAKYLNAHGIAAFILRYHLRSFGRRRRMPLRDVQRAIFSILAVNSQYDVSRQHWSIWGASAGGHLAGEYVGRALEQHLPLPETLVMLYPVVTMHHFTNRLTRMALIGPMTSEKTKDAHSLEQHVQPGWPPTFLTASEQDGLVPYQNSLLLARAIKRVGGEAHMRLYHVGHHGVGLGIDTPLEGWADAALAYWRDHWR